MTIKPVTTAKRVNASSADAEGKETHGVVGQVVVGEQAVVRDAHRNVVIDGHGQSPQRRVEVYDDLTRTHRCSPHKSTRSKRRDHHDHHHHKRDRVERGEKHNHPAVVVGSGVVSSKCGSPHLSVTPASVGTAGSTGVAVSNGNQSPEHLVHGCQTNVKTQTQPTANALKPKEETYSGYNSGDEHSQPKEAAISVEEWQRRDEQFAKCMQERGYELKPVEEDGACLFRSISLQIYGDEEMHDIIRQHTMDYIYKNREYFGQFVTEDINSYIKRKRRKDSHGNHIEIQAISEIYSRPVEVYCYESTPINIFNSEQSKNGYPPLRLSYQRGSHYNAILDPYNATVGVGLGLAGYKPEIQTKEAARLSEQLEIEQTMFEDKLKTTDWEATNEAIEEQIARESYLQWCRDNLHRSRATAATASSTSSTVTSAEAARSDSEASPSKYSMLRNITGDGNVGSSASAAAGTAGDVTTLLSGVTGLNATTVVSAHSPQNNPFDHAFALSPKSLNQLAHNLKKDVNVSELGYESDATDMSSTSSVGHCGGMSPTTAAVQRAKKAKNRRANCGTNTLRMGKKRRHEREAGTTSADKSTDADAPLRKSPKHEDCPKPISPSTKSDNISTEIEQQPCTSKQSNTPEKRSQSTETSDPNISPKSRGYSNFYQELLEASYATEGFTEAEMLNRAIQMSTQDYIEDQKRKYLYGP